MPDIVFGHIDDEESLKPVFEEFEEMNPGFKIGAGTFDADDGVLTSGYGGVRHTWVCDGEGEVFLPAGYRTKEGDGEKLPEFYVTDEVDRDVLEILQFLSEHSSVHEKIKNPLLAILERLSGKHLAGDIAGDIWLIVESGLPIEGWSENSDVRKALSFLSEQYARVGWSSKEVDSFEPIRPGDQITITGDEEVRVKGAFRYWWIENTEAILTHTSTARRLRYLKDTAGGCNFAFDAFRRLPLTWYVNTGDEENPDGINTINSHVVNIAAETSQTHYHPAIPVGGGKPQSELYFVLDPAVYSLSTYGRKSYMNAFPDVGDVSKYVTAPLSAGSVVYIPPGTGHRGVDVFVNVVTLPGFKPLNEVYIDQKIKDDFAGKSPYNENIVI